MKTLIIHPKDRTTDFLKPIYHGRKDVTVITGGCTKADVAKRIDEHDHIVMMGHGTPQGLLSVGQFKGKSPVSKPSMKPAEAIRSQLMPETADAAEAGAADWWKEDVKKVYSPQKAEQAKGHVPTALKAYSSYGQKTFDSSWFEDITTGYVIDEDNVEQLRDKKVTAIWCNADQFMEWNQLTGFYTGMFISDTSEAAIIGCVEKEEWMVDESNYAFSNIFRRCLDQDAESALECVKQDYGKLAERNPIVKYNYLRLYANES